MSKFWIGLLILSLSLWGTRVAAQNPDGGEKGLQVTPIGHAPKAQKGDNNPNLRTAFNKDTLELPFWDDFSSQNNITDLSMGNQTIPDTLLWQNSQNVSINNGRGNRPPTLGVATFDGVNINGRPYSNPNDDQGYTAIGLADSLVSKAINLSQVPQNKRETVFISFFWQLEGNGEIPDNEDSLRLQFKAEDGTWHSQWAKKGGEAADNQFQQVILPVEGSEFFHSGFQFKFENFSRLSGPFDNWHIDYVFLNSNRSESNTAYFDRALTTPPSSPFKGFTAVPMKQFKAAPDKYLGATSVGFYNLDALLQPIEYSAIIRDRDTRNTLQVLDNNKVVNPVPQGFERRAFTSSPLTKENFNLGQDSLYLLTEFYIKSGDAYLIDSINRQTNDTVYFKNVNYRYNDTARATYVLHDYFAYDDGGAEFGAGVNQNRGKIAYQYVMEETDILTHIDIYFPKIGKSQSGVPFNIYVWKKLEDNQIMTKQLATVQPTSRLDQFFSYKLKNAIAVSDTFYIGIEQQTDEFLSVGLDKNTDSGNKIFFNVTGAWERNEKVKGSLMMRPRFGDEDIISSTEPPITSSEESIMVYPNPGNGLIKIKGDYENLEVFNIIGSKIPFNTEKLSRGITEINIRQFPQGIYLLRFKIQDGRFITKKFMLNK